MIAKGLTIREATEKWVREMNCIAQGMIEELMTYDPDDWFELTVPVKGDRVYVSDADEHFGSITAYKKKKKKYTVKLDNEITVEVEADEFEVVRYNRLPIWGAMWSFDDGCDNYWLVELDGIRKMSECGYRIYESDTYGFFFGIDGAGYDFYSEHWVPLYKTRGLQWHDPDLEKEVN